MRPAAGALVLVAVALAAGQVLADEDKTGTVLNLSQVAEHVVPRDRLTIDLRAEATGGTPREVQAAVNRTMAAALAKARAVAAVKVQTGSYDTFETTPINPDGTRKPPVQWRASQTLSLTTRDIDAALTLAGGLQDDGMLLSDMRFDVAPETLRAQQHALTDEALAGIKRRAGEVAAALGLSIARIRSLTVGNAGQPGSVTPMMMARAAKAASAPAPVAEAGETTVSVSVNAEIALVPGK